MTRRFARPSVLALGLLASVACGPPKAGGVADDGETSSEGSSEGTATGTSTGPTTSDPTGPDPTGPDPSETDSDDGPVTTNFVPETDIICDCSQCDPFAQDCPEGEKCVPYPSTGGPIPDANKCVMLDGELPPGSPCTMEDTVSASDDCDALGICWDRVDGVHGTCRAFCQGTADNPICGEGEVCLLAYEGSTNVCVPACDPLLQDCEAGLGCYWSGEVFACMVTVTGIDVGQPCGYLADCNPGLECVDADLVPGCEGSSCCTGYCDVSVGDADCAALPGSSCVTFFEEGTVPPEWEDIGLCVAP